MTLTSSWILDHSLTFGSGFIMCLIIHLVFRKVDNSSEKSAKEESGNSKVSFPVKGLREKEENIKMVLVIRNDLKMGKGKAAAQCSHGAIMAYDISMKQFPDRIKSWRQNGQPKIVVKTESEAELLALYDKSKKSGLGCALVHDAGRTQIPSGTCTVVAIGPGPAVLTDNITGHLKLY